MAKARILAVDDQRYFRELIASMLAEEGFDAQTAAGGEEALRLLEKSSFDVVLTDLVMPGMDGSELVRLIKQRHPEQEVVIVTGVVDVTTAVEAMKLGASDYLLKPFERRALAVCLETLLQRKRLRAEHDRLLAENIEYVAETTLLEHALELFTHRAVAPLCERMLEALCVETGAQSGAVWVASEGDRAKLELAAARGLVRVAEEPRLLALEELPEPLASGDRRCALTASGEAAAAPVALHVALRDERGCVAVARLTDKLEGGSFDPHDLRTAERLAEHAERALVNALLLRGLAGERREGPTPRAGRLEFLRDAVRNEIERAKRFGRSFALLKLDVGGRAAGERAGMEPDAWLARVTELVRGGLRSTDLLALDDAERFTILLAESDALEGAAFKRRLLALLGGAELLSELPASVRPRPRAGLAVYPGDGHQLEALERVADERAAAAGSGPVERLGLAQLSMAEGLRALLARGTSERPETAARVVRFAIGELGRRPDEHSLLCVVPGATLAESLRQGLAALNGIRSRAELIVVGGERPAEGRLSHVFWLPEERLPDLPPCLLHYGDGAAYVMVRDAAGGDSARFFHSDDRDLVEHLAFRLKAALAQPGAGGP